MAGKKKIDAGSPSRPNAEQPARPGVLALIGNTPLVPIRAIKAKAKVEIFAKLERANPGGSVKDRIALFMIEEAERSGELTKDKTILEATSGNTGIGLATVAAIKGYPILLAMSEGFSFLKVLFETVSAFGTVGLSTGITPELSTVGRLLITVTMFFGRLGPLTLTLALIARQRPTAYRYPKEVVRIG